MAFSPTEARDAHGRFASSGVTRDHVVRVKKRAITRDHVVRVVKPAGVDASYAAKAREWLQSGRAQKALGDFAATVKASARDPETIKSVTGAAVNAAIGHYVYTHDYVDSDIVAHAVQNVEIGLAVTASQAHDVLTGATDALSRAASGVHDVASQALGALQRTLAAVKSHATDIGQWFASRASEAARGAVVAIGQPEARKAVVLYGINVAIGNVTGLSPGTPGLLDDGDVADFVDHLSTGLKISAHKARAVGLSAVQTLIKQRQKELRA